MAIVFGLISLGSIAYCLICLVQAVNNRRRFLNAAAALGAVVVFGGLALWIAERDARREGFLSRSDQMSAERAGITDAAVWDQRREVELEKQRSEDQASSEATAAVRREATREVVASRTAVVASRTAVAVFEEVSESQAAFVAAIDDARQAEKSATNDLAKGGVRRDRRDALCRIVDGEDLQSWAGKVTRLKTNSDGLGVVAIAIGDGVHFATWNNMLSDGGDNTLIDPSTPIFEKLATLKEGDRIRFSGLLFRDSTTDCFREMSLTMSGSMDAPEFLMRFTDIEFSPEE